MGYYTQYKLAVDAPESEDLADISAAHLDTIPVKDLLSGRADSMKWYDHEDDLRALSRKFPNVLFTLSGEGEESGDVWKKYFRDGKCQVAKAVLTIAPFDPEQLA